MKYHDDPPDGGLFDDEVFLINPGVHRGSGFKTHQQFLERLSSVEAIRERRQLLVLHFYPTSEAECLSAELLHAAVNSAKFEGMSRYDGDKIFGLIVPRKLYAWFKNSPAGLIGKQIACWLAGLYRSDADKQSIMEAQIYPTMMEEIRKVAQQHFPRVIPGVDNEQEVEDPGQEEYVAACASYYGAQPPEVLGGFGAHFDPRLYRPGQFDTPFDLHDAWRLDQSLFAVRARDIYFRSSDWKGVVVKGDSDTLLRAESSRSLWAKWKLTYGSFPTRNDHVFSLYGELPLPGIVYLVESGTSGRFKIGFTRDDDARNRLDALQTGNPEPLHLVKEIPVGSIQAEKALHRLFEAQRLSGEWFQLTPAQVKQIGDPEWRQAQGVL